MDRNATQRNAIQRKATQHKSRRRSLVCPCWMSRSQHQVATHGTVGTVCHDDAAEPNWCVCVCVCVSLSTEPGWTERVLYGTVRKKSLDRVGLESKDSVLTESSKIICGTAVWKNALTTGVFRSIQQARAQIQPRASLLQYERAIQTSHKHRLYFPTDGQHGHLTRKQRIQKSGAIF